jgi:CubicO group peptidase (beta-lactamase class C family)
MASRPRTSLPLALAVCALAFHVRAEAQFPPDSVVLSIIKQRVADSRNAGIVVGMLEADGRTRILSAGDAGPGQPALDGNSVFEIASITKVFTATVLAELVKEGRVSLDDPIEKFLPKSVRVPSRDGKPITLGNLSEHNSGLPDMPDDFSPKDSSNPFADYAADQLYAFLSHYTLPRDPGSQYEYSNLGVGLLGHVLTLITGRSYEDMERERVWKPLGMSHTGVAFTPWMKAHLALGHDAQGAVTANWDADALAGAGAIRSTTVDMLKFAAANLHPERGRVEQAMAFAQQERANAGSNRIGLTWMSKHLAGDTVVWHSGGSGGYGTFIGLSPSRHIAVVVMTNSSTTRLPRPDNIGLHLLDPAIIPLAPAPTPTPTPLAAHRYARTRARVQDTLGVGDARDDERIERVQRETSMSAVSGGTPSSFDPPFQIRPRQSCSGPSHRTDIRSCARARAYKTLGLVDPREQPLCLGDRPRAAARGRDSDLVQAARDRTRRSRPARA